MVNSKPWDYFYLFGIIESSPVYKNDIFRYWYQIQYIEFRHIKITRMLNMFYSEIYKKKKKKLGIHKFTWIIKYFELGLTRLGMWWIYKGKKIKMLKNAVKIILFFFLCHQHDTPKEALKRLNILQIMQLISE